MKNIKIKIAIVIIFLTSNYINLNAINLWWIGGTGTQQTNVASNWSTTNPAITISVAVSPPTAQDDVHFTNASFPSASTYTINTTGTWNVRNINISGVGNATSINFSGSGTINHYGSFTSINSPNLNLSYAGTFKETYNSSFSLSMRVWDLNGENFSAGIDIELRTIDTMLFASNCIQAANQIIGVNHYYGTVIMADNINPTFSWIKFIATANSSNEKIHFKGGSNFITLNSFNPVNSRNTAILIGLGTGNTGDISIIDFTNINFIMKTSSYLYSQITTPGSWSTSLKSITADNSSFFCSVIYPNGRIGKVKGGAWGFASLGHYVDTLESTNLQLTNTANGTIKVKKVIYPKANCGNYFKVVRTNFQWMGNYYAPASGATDTLKNWITFNCHSLDSFGTAFTGSNKTLLINSRFRVFSGSGFNFIAGSGGRKLYWIGGSGIWSDISHWSLSSGGSPLSSGSCPPTYIDDVYFDENSFTANGQTMTMTEQSECHNMIWDKLSYNNIDWLGNQQFDLFGTLRLDVKMKHLSSGNNSINLYGRKDTIYFDGNRYTAPYLQNFTLTPQPSSHYDILDFAYFGNINHGTFQNQGTGTYMSFPDTCYFGSFTGGNIGYTRPGPADTIDFAKNNTQYFHRPGLIWCSYGNPKILHNSNTWMHIWSGSINITESSATGSNNGRWPNTRFYFGTGCSHKNGNTVVSKCFLSGYNPWANTSGNTITLGPPENSNISCTDLRTTDTLIRYVLNTGFTISDSFVFARKGACLSKNVFGSVNGIVYDLNINSNKVKVTGTEFTRMNYNGSSSSWNAGFDNFDGGGNVDIIFGAVGTVKTFYWRKDPATNTFSGSWDLPNNWTTNKSDLYGQGINGCSPSAADSVVFDYMSSDGGSYTINTSNAFSCVALHGDSCRGTLTFTGNGNFTIGGTFRINTTNIIWNHQGNLTAGFSGIREWALGNNTTTFGTFNFNGPGKLELNGNTTKRFNINGTFFHYGGNFQSTNVPFISWNAYYGIGRTLTITNTSNMTIRSYHTPGANGTQRGMVIDKFYGTETKLRLNDGGYAHEINYMIVKNLNIISFSLSGSGSTRTIYGGYITADSLISQNGTEFYPALKVNRFIGLNPSLTYSFYANDTFTKSFYTLGNTSFNSKTLFNETYLGSDRTHKFKALDTMKWMTTGTLVKVGDLSKIINLRSTINGSRALFTKPFLSPVVYLCNIDVKDIKADTTPLGAQFRTNNVSIFNNSPGWRVISAGAGAVSNWQDSVKLIFRGDSANFTYLWDSTGQGPFRLIYTVNGFNRDSFTVPQEVYKHNIYLGNFTDSSLIGNVISKRFECPGIYIPDSVNASKDTFYIHCPQTENGLAAGGKKGAYPYNNLNTWVYMMDTSQFLTICAFWDKTTNTDKDSLGITNAQVNLFGNVRQVDSFYVAQRHYQITPNNNKAAKLRLFITKNELDSIRIKSGFSGSNTQLLPLLRILRTPNAQSALSPYFKHNNAGTGIATEVNTNTYFVDVNISNGQWSNFYLAAPGMHRPVTKDTVFYLNPCINNTVVHTVGANVRDLDTNYTNVAANIQIIKTGTKGTASIVANNIQYVYTASNVGQDTVEYTVTDESGLKDTGHLFVNIIAYPGGIPKGLVLWLKADDGFVGGLTGDWKDHSKNALIYKYGIGSLGTINTSSTMINYNPAIHFDGTSYLENNTKILGDSSTYTKFAIFNIQNTANNNAIIASGGSLTPGQNIHGFYHNATGSINGYHGDNFGSGGNFVTGIEPVKPSEVYLGSVRYGYTTGNNNRLGLNGDVNISNLTQIGYLDKGTQIGADQAGVGFNTFTGDFGELIMFDTSISNFDVEKVESYLGIKYGVTLKHNYLSGAGNVIWNRTNNTGYNFGIFGIGRDDCQSLYQKQSLSNQPDLITIGAGSIVASNSINSGTISNSSFEIIGNSGGSFSAWTATNSAPGSHRIARAWKVQESGTVGSIHIRIPHSTSTAINKIPTGMLGDLYLFVDNDSNFTTGAVPVKLTLVGSNWEGSFDFSNNDVFTIGYLGLIRKTEGDFEVNTGCPLVNGSGKVVFTDLAGNLVFSIDPKGNNLGNVCWGIKILKSPNDSVRRMDMQNSWDTFKYHKGYILDRNLYIKPQYQPNVNYIGVGGPNNLGNAKPIIEWYFLKNELKDILISSGKSINDSMIVLNDSLKVTKFSPFDKNTEDLIWENNQWKGIINQTLNQTWNKHGNDFKFSFEAPSFSEFWAGWIPGTSPSIPLLIKFIDLRAERISKNEAIINWSVNEINQSFKCRVMKSYNGINWFLIETLKTSELNFSIFDKNAGSNYAYYKIIIDDGNFEIVESNIVFIKPIVDYNNSIIIYPNPNNGNFYIKSLINEEIEIKIYNQLGETTYSNKIQTNELIDTKFLNNGIYFLLINFKNSFPVTEKLLILK